MNESRIQPMSGSQEEEEEQRRRQQQRRRRWRHWKKKKRRENRQELEQTISGEKKTPKKVDEKKKEKRNTKKKKEKEIREREKKKEISRRKRRRRITRTHPIIIHAYVWNSDQQTTPHLSVESPHEKSSCMRHLQRKQINPNSPGPFLSPRLADEGPRSKICRLQKARGHSSKTKLHARARAPHQRGHCIVVFLLY